jgi:predicted house-cleaning NTP pyrophosphatase (Maf/HAM1 superfamily)
VEKTIIECDLCGLQAVVRVGVSLHKARLVAEDDNSYVVTCDFCVSCASRLMEVMLAKSTEEARLEWVKLYNKNFEKQRQGR